MDSFLEENSIKKELKKREESGKSQIKMHQFRIIVENPTCLLTC